MGLYRSENFRKSLGGGVPKMHRELSAATSLHHHRVGGWEPGPVRLGRGGHGQLELVVEEAVQGLLLTLDRGRQLGKLSRRGQHRAS